MDDVEMFERRIHAKSSDSFESPRMLREHTSEALSLFASVLFVFEAMQTIGIPHEEVAQILRMVASASWRRFGAGQQRQGRAL